MKEAELLIEIGIEKGRVNKLGISSRRRLDACRIAEGRAPEEAMAMIPMLYGVCGKAQAAAASAACSQAAGMDREEKGLSVLVETASEHLWRFHLDWPAALGLKSEAGHYFALRKRLDAFARNSDAGACAEILEDHLNEHLFGKNALFTSGSWKSLPFADHSLLSQVVYHLSGRGGSWDCPQLAAPSVDALAKRLAGEPGFSKYPALDGVAFETGAYSRMKSHPLLANSRPCLYSRFAARMLELAALPGRIRTGESPVEKGRDMPSGTGAACVATARGVLLHRMEMNKGKIGRYQILSPTEWNFHPRGALYSGLMGMEAEDMESLRNRAETMILALDPCVGHELKVSHA